MRRMKAFIGHFFPHIALVWFVYSAVSDIQSMIERSSLRWPHLPWEPSDFNFDWSFLLASMLMIASVILLVVAYEGSRRWHSGHRCSWCDRNGRRWRQRTAGIFAMLYDMRMTRTGCIVMLCAFAVSLVTVVFSPIGGFMIDAGLALGLTTTIMHQQQSRGCTAHNYQVLFEPGTSWAGTRQTLRQLHTQSRGADRIELRCSWCREEKIVVDPAMAMPWLWTHVATRCQHHLAKNTRLESEVLVSRLPNSMLADLRVDPQLEGTHAPAEV